MPYLKSPMFTVYRYIAPDGRSYIGKTGLQQGARAQHNGAGYKSCPRFWAAIQKHGWEKFTYQVLAEIPKTTPDAEKKACELESRFIKEFRTTNSLFGFNERMIDVPKNYSKLAAARRCMRPMYKEGIVRQIPKTDYARYLADGWKPGYNRTS